MGLGQSPRQLFSAGDLVIRGILSPDKRSGALSNAVVIAMLNIMTKGSPDQDLVGRRSGVNQSIERNQKCHCVKRCRMDCSLAELPVPALSVINIPGLDNWQADYLSR